MKKTTKLFLSFVFCLLSFVFYSQQNFVPNPSFEEDTACPNNTSQIYKLKDWFTTNVTPDYFNKCYNGSFDYVDIPKNSFGYQNVNALCHSYVGLFTAFPFNNCNETQAAKLIDSLIKNTKYYFSMKVSLANTKWASNNLGAFFSTKMPVTTLTASANNFAQIQFSQIISDTLNWTTLFKSFVADSNYKFISLGNFFDSTSTSKFTYNPTGAIGAYYFLDDVCLSNDSTFAYNYSFNCSTVSITENSNYKKINIYPNPANEYINIDVPFEDYYYSIIDFSGRTLFISDLVTTYQKMNISKYNNGFYFIQLFNRSKNIIITEKLIIFNH